MASYGLIIRNKNRQIIIDENYRNQAIRYTGFQSQTGSELGYYFADFSIACSASAVIGYKTSGWVALQRQSHSGNIRTIRLISRSPFTVQWFCFDTPTLSSKYSINYGLRIKNRVTGDLVFDSRARYLRVKLLFDAKADNQITSRVVQGVTDICVVPTQAFIGHQEEVFGATGPNHYVAWELAPFFNTPGGGTVRTQVQVYYTLDGDTGGSYLVTNFSSGGSTFLVSDISNYF